MEIIELKKKAIDVRMGALAMVHQGKGHIGGTLSSADILTALFYRYLRFSPENQKEPNRDRFILSKGHNSEGYYWTLADRGFFSAEELNRFLQHGAMLQGHPSNNIPGVEMSTGALGHGLSLACGVALSSKITHVPFRVFVLMGDGETNEGSVWEAAMFASAKHLDNLFVFIDRNGFQLSGATEEVMPLEPYEQKWETFGFETFFIDGNDMEQICSAIDQAMSSQKEKPKAIICKTHKGQGVDFMKDNNKWHHGTVDDAQYESAVQQLEKERAKLL